MGSRSNLVPSKDALRALRSLALSPHVALLGTVGSVCGLAALHYHESRKLSLAGRIAETRRKIHTISGGRGVAQLNRMFEAAEKGEDFTLHHGRPMKQQKRRQSYMVAMARHEDVEFLPAGPSRNSHSLGRGEQSGGINIVHPPEPSPIPVSHESKVQRTPASHAGRSPFNRRRQSTAVNVLRNYKDAAAHAREVQQDRYMRWKEDRVRNLDGSAATSSENHTQQAMTDLNPAPVIQERVWTETQSQTSTLPMEESLFFNFVFGDESLHPRNEVPGHDGISSWGPSESAVISSIQSLARRTFAAQSSTSGPTTDIFLETPAVADIEYIPPGVPSSTRTFSHNLTSRYVTRDDNVLQSEYDAEPRYQIIFDTIGQIVHDSGSIAGLSALNKVLETYVATGNEDDFTIVKLLILEFTHYFDTKSLASTIRKLVRKSLARTPPRLDTVSLLYPYFGDEKRRIGQFAYFFAMRYLEDVCATTPDLDEHKAELVKILEGTIRCGIQPDEQLLLPLLRHRFSCGKTKEAQELVDDIQASYGINFTFYTSNELLRGYASTGNWWKVKAILYDLHAEGKSRKHVHGYAGLFARTLDEYMSKHAIDKSCAFVMHGIKEAGLLPTSSISTRIILGCIRERRYDLLRQYVNMVQRDYQDLDLGIIHAQFASNLSGVWTDMAASCEDVLNGCKAMAVNAIRDPFSKPLRGIVSEVVSKDLYAHIRALEDQGTVKMASSSTRPNIKTLTDSVRQLVKHHHNRGLTPITRPLAEDLVRQTKAVSRIDQVLSGSYLVDLTIPEQDEQKANQKEQNTGKQLPRMPPGLKAMRLPPSKDILTMLYEFYEGRRHQGLPVDHSVLQYVAMRLSQQSRHADAYGVMETVYTSAWAELGTGRPFTMDLFTQWLRLALQIRSGSKVKDVIWAVVEAAAELDISHDFLLLARIALPKTLLSRDTRARGGDIDEGEYLSFRLRRRRAQQAQFKNNRSIVFNSWKQMGNPST